MSKQNKATKEKSCDGKYPYNSKAEASHAAALLNGRNKVKKEMEAYKCQYCGKYHFGHTRTGTGMKRVKGNKRNKEKLTSKDYTVNWAFVKAFSKKTEEDD